MAIKKSSPQRASAGHSDGKKPFRRRGPKNKGVRPADPNAQRLNKILAAAGLGSRRDVEELILQGRVEIDREIVTDLSCKVDPRTVVIKVDGTVLKKEQLIYYALNKPTGVLSTNRDPDGRMRVIDLVPDKHRVFSVGRLDRSSEGLILLTNDGELAQRLAHPKFSVQKSYFVVVSGVMTQDELDRLRKGVHLAEGFARIDGATIRRQRKGCTELEIVLSEGKNREIRRILARAGHKVVVLRRIAIGPLRLGQLPTGAARILLPSEVRALYAATEQKPAQRKKPAKAAKPSVAVTAKAKRPADEMDDDEALPAKPYFDRDRGRPVSEEDDDDDDLFMLGMDDDLSGLSENFNDDDFVGHFSGSTAGAVLSYDDEAPVPAKPKRPSKPTSSTKRPMRRSPGGRHSESTPAEDAQQRGASKHEANRAAGPRKAAAKGSKRSGNKVNNTASGKRGATSKNRTSGPPARGKGTQSRPSKGR